MFIIIYLQSCTFSRWLSHLTACLDMSGQT